MIPVLFMASIVTVWAVKQCVGCNVCKSALRCAIAHSGVINASFLTCFRSCVITFPSLNHKTSIYSPPQTGRSLISTAFGKSLRHRQVGEKWGGGVARQMLVLSLIFPKRQSGKGNGPSYLFIYLFIQSK